MILPIRSPLSDIEVKLLLQLLQLRVDSMDRIPMDDVRDSKRISKALRHRPDIPHDEKGWFLITDISKSTGLSEERILQICRTNTRYMLTEDGSRVRAMHGHSIDVEYENLVEPPDILYHGTTDIAYKSIKECGSILPMGRKMVHLSTSAENAMVVAKKRKGQPVILYVDSISMYRDGFDFYESGDGVYLVDSVPIRYIAPM